MLTHKQVKKEDNVQLQKGLYTEIDRAIARTVQALRCMDPKDPDMHVEIGALTRVLEYLCSIKLRSKELERRGERVLKSAKKYKQIFVDENRTQGKKPMHLAEFLQQEAKNENDKNENSED